jgi:hypothetical protein
MSVPAYADKSAQFLHENQSIVVWDGQSVTTSTASQAVQLERRKSNNHYPWGMSVQVTFASDPGTVTVAVETSDTDTDATYVQLTTLTATNLNSSFCGRIEVLYFWAKYVRLKIVTITAPTVCTGIITR